MESKKTFASFAEDSPSPSGGPSSFLVRPLSPQRTGRLGRRKSSQAAASISGHEGLPILSCVTRETSQEDCARHRFIVWAAVKRNSCSAISAPEKLECPLLRCRRRFPDHETMLRHLAGCEHLPSGEYWCHEHTRIERFDDVKCKRCLGHPSKRRKMLSMAKSFFQSLGHKPRKGPSFECDEDSDCLPPPPSYESLEIGPCGMGAELSATEIVEIDSTEVGISNITEENIPDPGIDPQALLIPELDSTAVSYESFIQWPAPTAPNMQNDLTPAGHEECRSPLGKPALQVTTHGLDQYRKAPRPAPRQIQSAPRSKGLSPSSSVRSTTSTTSTTSNVSSLVSPVSTWSGAWSLASGAHTNMTTPIDLVSPSAFLSEHPFGRETDCQEGYMDGICSELPADYPTAGPPLDMAADALFCSFDAAAPTDMTYASNIVLTDDLGAPLDLPGPELHDSNICCSETKAMVGSAWDTLQEHLASSVRKTQYLDNNPLAEYLRSLSTKSIALIGLRALKGVLDGHLPTSPRETLCFIHLIYAFSLVVHESEAAARSVQLFLQALAYRGNFPREDQQPYTRIVLEIWQPLGIPQDEIDRLVSLPAPPFPRQNGKQPELQARKSDFRRTDAMLSAARDFLDELESSLVFGEAQSTIEVLTSDLYSKHFQDFSLAAGNTPFTVTVSFVVTVLIQDFSDVEGLIGRLNGVHQRVNSGIISSVRRAELELLQSAKGCMAPSAYFDRFAPTVRKLCDPIYQQHESGTLGRDSYCALGISLVESIFTQFDTPSVQISLPTGDKDETLDGFFGDLTPALAPDAMEQFVDAECLLDLPIDEIHMEMKPSTEPIPCPNTYFGTPVIPQTTSAEPETGLGGQQEVDLAQQSSKVESDACCEICGYRPKGDPQWFKGSMAKHKKLQHSAAPPKIYRCPYPGCVSAYKNRPDNLRQHQIEKGHFVGEEAGRRPSKRKKLAED